MKKMPLIPCNIIARIQNIVACFEVKRARKVTVRVRERNRVRPKAILIQRWFTEGMKQYSLAKIRNIIGTDGIFMPLRPSTSIIIYFLIVTRVTS